MSRCYGVSRFMVFVRHLCVEDPSRPWKPLERLTVFTGWPPKLWRTHGVRRMTCDPRQWRKHGGTEWPFRCLDFSCSAHSQKQCRKQFSSSGYLRKPIQLLEYQMEWEAVIVSDTLEWEWDSAHRARGHTSCEGFFLNDWCVGSGILCISSYL